MDVPEEEMKKRCDLLMELHRTANQARMRQRKECEEICLAIKEANMVCENEKYEFRTDVSNPPSVMYYLAHIADQV